MVLRSLVWSLVKRQRFSHLSHATRRPYERCVVSLQSRQFSVKLNHETVNVATTETPIVGEMAVAKVEFASEMHRVGLIDPNAWYNPAQLVRSSIEFLHDAYDIPWLQAVAVVAMIARTLALPGNVVLQRFMTKHANSSPERVRLSYRCYLARQSGDALAYNRAAQAQVDFEKAQGTSPLLALLGVIPQAVILMSVYRGLWPLTSTPFVPMKAAGLWGFTDLTIADPTMVLPLAAAGVLLTIPLTSMATGQRDRNILAAQIGLPILVLPFLCYMPSLLCVHFLVANTVTATFHIMMMSAKVREVFGIVKVTQSAQITAETARMVEEMKRNPVRYADMRDMTQAAQRAESMRMTDGERRQIEAKNIFELRAAYKLMDKEKQRKEDEQQKMTDKTTSAKKKQSQS